MAKTCLFIITIKNIDGTSEKITIEIDPTKENYSSPGDLINLLAKDTSGNNLRLFLEKVNKTHFPLTSLSLSDISGNMICNYSLATASNLFKSEKDPELNNLYRKLKDTKAFNEDDFNIIITDNTSGMAGTYYSKEYNRFITIIPNSVYAFKCYLKFLLTKHEALTNPENELILAFLLYILEIKDKVTKNKTLKIRYPRLYKAVTEEDLNEFLNVYYNDYTSYKYITKQAPYDNLRKVLKEAFKPINIVTDRITNKAFKKLIDLILKDRAISLTDIKTFAGTLEDLKDPVAFTLYINKELLKAGLTDHFFDIKFIGNDKVLYRQVKQEPTFATPVINAHYYGKIVQPIYDSNGYHIYKIGNTVYASSFIPDIEEDGALGHPFTSYEKAKEWVDKKSKATISENDRSFTYSLNRKPTYETTETDLPSIFRFMALKRTGKDTKNETLIAATLLLITEGIKLLDSKPLKEALDSMVNNPGNKDRKAIQDLISYVGTSSLKFRVFLRVWQKFVNSHTAHPFETAVEYMQNEVLEVMYLATLSDVNDNTRQYSIKEISNDKIPLYITKPRMLRLDIAIIAEKLKTRFGVNVELLTTAELIKKFPDINPSANAFIKDSIVYVNIDRAYSNNLLHEFGHLIFGTIKLTRFDLYDKFIKAVDTLRITLPLLFKYYQASSRSRYDINEEVLVDIFGKLLVRGIKAKINVTPSDLNEMIDVYKKATDAVFGSDTQDAPITSLLQMTLDSLKTEYGATALNDVNVKDITESVFDVDLAYTSRKIANLIERLKNDGALIENCVI